MRELFNTERRLRSVAKRIGGDGSLASCWEWKGAINKQGYGILSVNEPDKVRCITAQRIVYSLFWGEIPEGLVVDHACRNRECVNPYHLRAITNRQNILIGMCWAARNLRKTHCVRGHLLDGNNLLMVRGADRSCRTCARMHKRAWENRNRGKSWPL